MWKEKNKIFKLILGAEMKTNDKIYKSLIHFFLFRAFNWKSSENKIAIVFVDNAWFRKEEQMMNYRR